MHSAVQNYSGSPRNVFLVQEIASGARKAGRYAATTGDFWFFDSDNQVFRLPKTQAAALGANLDMAEPLAPVPGKIFGLMAFRDDLLLLAGQGELGSLYCWTDGAWLPLSAFGLFFPASPWCVAENGRYLFFCGKAASDGQSVIWGMGEDKKLFPVANLPEADSACFFLTQHADSIWAVLPRVKALFQAKLFSRNGHLLPMEKVIFQETQLPFAPFRVAFLDDSMPLLAPDGATELFTLDNKRIFSDDEPEACGFQIAATARFSGLQDYRVLGTWRRDAKHPVACLYILQNGRLIYKHAAPTAMASDLKWTGYECLDGSTREREDMFIPCYGCSAIYIRKLPRSNFDVVPDGLQGATIIHQDDKTLILERLRVLPYEKSAEAAVPSPLASLSTLVSSGYYLRPPAATSTRIYLTFDVEQHVPGPPYCLTGAGLEKECGVYWIMDQLEKYGHHGVFFVNIYEHPNFTNGLLEKMVRDIDARGHEVGLHHHAGHLPFNPRPLPQCTKEEQRIILAYGRDFLHSILGKYPVSFRAGGYALNDDTLEILEELDFKLDSSFFLGINQKDVTYRSKNRPAYYGKLLEIPITTHAALGYRSKIDINAHSKEETLRNLLSSCRGHGLNDLVFMGHSFSFLRFSKKKEDSPYGFAFTGRRYLTGIPPALMQEFSNFLTWLSLCGDFSVWRFCDVLSETNLGQSRDVIPYRLLPQIKQTFCPVCEQQVVFQPYRGRADALCPACRSLERVRLKYLYLKFLKRVEHLDDCSILHIGPNLKIRSWLKSLPNLDYISIDPFNEADFPFSIESIPFANNSFEMILCVGVLMHVLDDDKALQEMSRVLRTGGELLLWLGDLNNHQTKEYYNRDEFPIMEAHDFSHPDDVQNPTLTHRGGKILYNPRFATRAYGIDIIDKLSNYGLDCCLMQASSITENPKMYCINENEKLLVCKKR